MREKLVGVSLAADFASYLLTFWFLIASPLLVFHRIWFSKTLVESLHRLVSISVSADPALIVHRDVFLVQVFLNVRI